MKKKLLSFMFTVVACTTVSYAQTKVWDFGNDATTWPLSTGIGTSAIIVDNLGLYPNSTNGNFGAVNASSGTFSDSYVGANRFQLNGTGSPATGTFLPSQRYLFMDVSGACTVKLWFRTGGSGTRNMLLTNGTSLIATAGSGTSGDAVILTGSVTAAGRIYLYADSSCNLYKLEVTGATVSTTSTTLSSAAFEKELGATVYTTNKEVYVSNITEATTVKVFNVTGQLVKTVSISGNANFDLNHGLYILSLESTKGKKTVKIAIK